MADDSAAVKEVFSVLYKEIECSDADDEADETMEFIPGEVILTQTVR